MGRKSDVEPSRRLEAVVALLRREEPGVALARRYGVSETTLTRWKESFLEGGKQALANGSGGQTAADRRVRELEAQVAERDRVIGELTIANRILKKGGAEFP
jgi:transposase